MIWLITNKLFLMEVMYYGVKEVIAYDRKSTDPKGKSEEEIVAYQQSRALSGCLTPGSLTL